jgi:IclR family KDG regulon transcriptional repressor
VDTEIPDSRRDTAQEKRQVPALARGLDILEFVRSADAPSSAAELTRGLGLPRTTVHELIQTLLARGYLDEVNGAPRRYRLGVRLFELGNVYAAGLDLAREGRAAAEAVAAECQETVQVAIRDGIEVIYVAKVDSTHPVRMVSFPGARLPAHLTGLGKMLLSAVPDEELAVLYPDGDELPSMTPHSIRSLDRLRQVLADIRRDGLAWDECESNPAVNCVAAPVYDHDHVMVAAMSISVPTIRWSAAHAARYAELVRRGAADLSRRLGHVAIDRGAA